MQKQDAEQLAKVITANGALIQSVTITMGPNTMPSPAAPTTTQKAVAQDADTDLDTEMAAQDNNDLGLDEETAPTYTKESVRSLISQFAQKKGKPEAKTLLGKFKANSVGDIKEKDYEKISQYITKVLAK